MPGTDAALLVAESVATGPGGARGAVRPERHGVLRVRLDRDQPVPAGRQDAETSCKNADAAMYQSKKHEPGGYVVFATERRRAMRAAVADHAPASSRRGAALGVALAADRRPRTGTVEGVEALVRWRDPNGGLVPPGRVHPARRGDRADRGDRRLGDRRAGRQQRGLEGGGHRDLGAASTCRPASSGRRTWRRRSSGACGRRRRPARRRRGDHRVDGDGRPRPHAADARRAARVGPHAGDRRLRHGLLVAGAAEAHARGHPEDRSSRSSATSTATRPRPAWSRR